MHKDVQHSLKTYNLLYLDAKGQRCISMCNICLAQLKSALMFHNWAKGPFSLSKSVFSMSEVVELLARLTSYNLILSCNGLVCMYTQKGYTIHLNFTFSKWVITYYFRLLWVGSGFTHS